MRAIDRLEEVETALNEITEDFEDLDEEEQAELVALQEEAIFLEGLNDDTEVVTEYDLLMALVDVEAGLK